MSDERAFVCERNGFIAMAVMINVARPTPPREIVLRRRDGRAVEMDRVDSMEGLSAIAHGLVQRTLSDVLWLSSFACPSAPFG